MKDTRCNRIGDGPKVTKAEAESLDRIRAMIRTERRKLDADPANTRIESPRLPRG